MPAHALLLPSKQRQCEKEKRKSKPSVLHERVMPSDIPPPTGQMAGRREARCQRVEVTRGAVQGPPKRWTPPSVLPSREGKKADATSGRSHIEKVMRCGERGTLFNGGLAEAAHSERRDVRDSLANERAHHTAGCRCLCLCEALWLHVPLHRALAVEEDGGLVWRMGGPGWCDRWTVGA